jgi:multisubunit Na+/H+ antiporter MnhG subunit
MRLIMLLGALFVVYGLIAFQLPTRWHNYTLGLGFGALHLLFGLLIARTDHAD